MAWTDIPAFVLDKVFGYQSANLLRENAIALKDAKFVVTDANPPNDFMPNVQSLAALPTGYLKNTIATGALVVVPTIPAADIVGSVPAAAHGTTHQAGGSDVFSLAGLSGLLVTPQTPINHHLTHQPGGSDQITDLAAEVITTGVLDIARLPVNARRQMLRHAIAHFTSPGSGIATGPAGVLVVPWDCTITEVILLSSDPSVLSGSIVIDIWKDSYTNYPPTVADSICASAKPTISSATKSRDTTLTGWTTALAAGDILAFNVDSAATLQHVAVALLVTLT